jgi:hypothetical protein
MLFGLLWATTAFGQGIILYTWHGSEGPSSLFQANFQIYDFEQTPGTWFSGTHLFDNTLTVTSPDHMWLPGTAASYASGFTAPGGTLYLDAVCHDLAFPGLEVDLIGGSTIAEYDANGVRFGERGFWTAAPVPEPSLLCPLAVGLVTLIVRRTPRGRRVSG